MSANPPSENLRVVRHDPHVGLSALFRLYAKETRPKLDVEYQPAGGDLTLHFRGPDALGMQEQTLMLVLQELAQEYRRSVGDGLLKSDAQSPEGRALWKNLYQKSDGALPETLWFPTSWYELARRTGKSHGGTVVQQLRQQLKRLCECVVWERYRTEDGITTEFQSFLMAMTYSDDKRLFIALNVRLSEAIVSHRYMPVSLIERLRLKSPAAKALHAFLSVWVRYGESQKVGKDTLADRVWPSEVDAQGKPKQRPDGTLRRHRSEVKAALKEIDALTGWSVASLDNDVVTISRAKAGDLNSSGQEVTRRATTRRSSARKKTCPNTSEDVAFREHQKSFKPNAGAGFQPIDASALFLS